ncbi:MAG: Na/Pi symporter [Methylococcales bacterium]|nr:Na/Pi symporter [Methylococcales bacterium]
MIRNFLLALVVLVLSYLLWLSPDFKGIAAGISIFLFGMLSLEQGFRHFTGGVLERILQKTTNKTWKSLSFGFISTTLMQSSSLVSIITISFLSAGLLELAAGIGIIFGANLGTSTGAWLIAGLGLKVKISAYAMPMLVFGVLFVFQENKKIKGFGYILAGLGFLFLGIHYMKESFEAFKSTLNLVDYSLSGVKGLLLYTLIGIMATVIMQSSHATMVLIITALSVQQITYDNALALAIGSNVGTTITAIIGSLSANVQGKRLAAAHLIFNMATGLIALLLIKQLVIAVAIITDALGIDANDYTLKLATFHSLFNLIGIIIMLPFINRMVIFLERVFKPKRPNIFKVKYLTDSAMEFPETVLEAVRQESTHLYDNAIHVILRTFGLRRAELSSNVDLADLIQKRQHHVEYDIDAGYEKRIKGIYSAIIAFISQAKFTWEMEQSSGLTWLRAANKNLVEAIKETKHLQKNLIRFKTSKNTATVTEYNNIAYQIVSLIQEIEAVRKDISEDELPLLSFDALKIKLEDNDVQMNRSVETLIREQHITPETGTSLINDTAYMYRIKKDLIKAAETLFIFSNSDNAQVESQLALNETEIQDVVDTMDEK